MPSLKLTRELERLKREVDGCEALIKQQNEEEEKMKDLMKKQNHELDDLKKKLEINTNQPDFKHVEERLEKKIESLKEFLLKNVTKQAKSYAEIASKGVFNSANMKTIIKTVRKEEIEEEREKGRRSLNLIIHGELEE